VCELTVDFESSGLTMSHHLNVLREAGLIEGDRGGMWIYYRVAGSSTDAGDGSPRCPKDHPETSDSRPRQCIPPGGKGLTPAASTRASPRWM
jgi:hypothetical protein